MVPSLARRGRLERPEARPTRAVVLVAVLCASALAGCQVYDPSLVDPTPATECALRRPPERPQVPDGDGPEVAFGMRNVVLYQGNDWADYGYDLDGSCTERPDYEAECTPPTATRAPADGPNGVDNTFGDKFFPVVRATIPDLEEQARHAQEIGQGPPIVRIRGWNGEDNDPKIDVAVMQAVFGMPGGDESAPPEPPEDPLSARPQWDGRDWFWVRDDAFVEADLERPFIRDDNAWVVDRQVVARLPDRVDIVFPASNYGVLVRITGAMLTGRISDDGTQLENVIVSGRWSLTDLALTARNIGICPSQGQYDLLLNQLNQIADVRSVPMSGGPDVKCDAISLGVGFTGSRVRVARTAPGLALADLCAQGAQDGGVADAGMSDAGIADAGVSDDAAGAADADVPE